MTEPLDLLAIGNAIVDVLAQADDAFLETHSVVKGSMTLIDGPRAEDLFGAMGPATVISGGSAANTVVGAASFGIRTAFIGKVREDQAGRLFTHDIGAMGVTFTTKPSTSGAATARSFIFVTPDGQRSMNTFLGACQDLDEHDVDADLVARAGITYLEGYLWDPPAAKKAFVKAATIAHGAKRRVALTLSDSFCVGRYRAEFLDLIRTGQVDIVFANEDELTSLYQSATFDEAVSALAREGILGVVTRSAAGSLVVTKTGVEAVPAAPIEALVDTTGAGDLFAAGFLTGLSRDQPLRECATLGALAAAEVIQHIGARPAESLAAIAERHGLAHD